MLYAHGVLGDEFGCTISSTLRRCKSSVLFYFRCLFFFFWCGVSHREAKEGGIRFFNAAARPGFVDFTHFRVARVLHFRRVCADA